MGLDCRGLSHELRYWILRTVSQGQARALSVRLVVICNEDGLGHDLVNDLALVVLNGKYDSVSEVSTYDDEIKHMSLLKADLFLLMPAVAHDAHWGINLHSIR
jgi:hypothetical protein